MKDKLLTFEGKPLFPERFAYTVGFGLSPAESTLYEAASSYKPASNLFRKLRSC
ncbi:MAG: hypothetical protein ACP5VR_08525 [Acidimicrobiales bacterium]